MGRKTNASKQSGKMPPVPKTLTPQMTPSLLQANPEANPQLERAELEIQKLQRDLAKVDEEIKTLKRGNRPLAYFWTVKITDFFAPAVAFLAALAAWQSGYLNATAAKNRAEELALQMQVAKLTDERSKLEVRNISLAEDEAKLNARILEAERVLFPMKEQTDAVNVLTGMIEKKLDVRMYHGFGINWVEMLVSGQPVANKLPDIAEMDLDAAFRAIEKIKRVTNLELHSLNISNDTLAALPQNVSRISFRECDMNCDLAELGHDSEITSLEIAECRGEVNVSRPIKSIGSLRLYKIGYAGKILAVAVDNLPSVRVLEVVGSGITDSDVAKLEGHPTLQYLSTFDNDVTVDVIASLKKIPKLTALTAKPTVIYSDAFQATEIFPFPTSPFTKIDTLLRSSPSRLIFGRSVHE